MDTFTIFKPLEKERRRNLARHLTTRVKIAIFVCAFFVLILVCLTSLWIFLAGDSAPDQSSDLDILRQHRKETETQVEGWINEVYELKKVAVKGYTTSGNFDTVTKRGYIMQEIVRKISVMKNSTLVQLQSSTEHQNLFRVVTEDLCQPENVCDEKTRRSPYRTFNGSCNNIEHPEWGMTGRAQLRLLPAMYSDDFGSPRMFGYYGDPLPSPRMISNTVHSSREARRRDPKTTVMVMAFGQFLSHDIVGTPMMDEARRRDPKTTVMVMAFGQFLSHDIVGTPMMDGHHSSVLKCCEEGKIQTLSGPFNACFSINIPTSDQFFHSSSCMTFTRSAPAICDKCKICGRDQINEMTSYIDASQVYGATETASRNLRSFTKGLLLSDVKGLLPKNENGNCRVMQEKQYCFHAGDGRVNVVPNLSSLHTTFVRLHNHIAGSLAKINPHWDDEKVFQETRKIVIAIMQNVVYHEYLPVILGNDHMAKYNLSTGSNFEAVYDSSVNATASNGFNTAAFRFGHMTVPGEQISLNDGYESESVSRIERTYHNPNMTFLYCDGLARWMVHGNGIQSDGLFSSGVRNLLFLDKNNISFDLAALNIQRGRDHGLPSYNQYRLLCNLPAITESEFRKQGTAMGNFSPENADLFRKIYRHPDDIDVYSGGVKETLLPEAQVGPTFACMIAQEFKRLKIGDRFYFANPRAETGFTIEQLLSIKGVRFAKVLCETMNISEVQPNVFQPIINENQLKTCEEFAHINLELWKEER